MAGGEDDSDTSPVVDDDDDNDNESDQRNVMNPCTTTLLLNSPDLSLFVVVEEMSLHFFKAHRSGVSFTTGCTAKCLH